MPTTPPNTGSSPDEVDTQDLADELAERFGLTRSAAREGVGIYIGQLNDLDGSSWEREVPADVAAFVRESFRAFYADLP